ncbi:MAG: ubiquinone/menaquinone biosynthesis methyltransferase [Anaerolineales bacterium]|nr:ubiquinone/menaquinone biosynthesis methyltransferase [Anaerolineales bacterium]
MSEPANSVDKRADAVQRMFTRIARRYDLMNRLMTGGQDVRWRKEVIRRACLPAGGRLLDLGAGTGDLAREALRLAPSCRPVAVDFTLAMMRVGQRRASSLPLVWCAADGLRLPFPQESFHAVVSGFLLRNVSDVLQCLREQHRVLKPEGVLVALDTTRPASTRLSPLVNAHLHYVIPTLGGWITGDREAYTYLPASTEGFLPAERLAELMVAAGFNQVDFRRVMLGTVAIHWGVK